ncbi:helix-turn-helix domain-containing protein [Kitasatospora sp. NPDC127059]|uniref:helix-turn-helix domain-containing protein n=1 Tax=unclassified Kitasatospora TaxID=2633591 RepID=UPI0036584B38
MRYLHKLFRYEGMTAARWIQRQRLDMCRRDLARRAAGRATVAAVAGRWGFVSASHVSRAFRAAYSVSPREWRAGAGTGSAPDTARLPVTAPSGFGVAV